MSPKVEKIDVWATSLKDQPGALAEALETLAEAGADLDFVVTRRTPDKPDEAVAFVSPLRGDGEVAAGAQAGFGSAESLHSIRIEGYNEAGICAKLTRRLADAGINLRGLSAAVIDEKYIIYLALDSDADANCAVEVLTREA